METSWLIGAGTIVGLGLYLKSISDSKSTSPRGLTEVNTELADSDKPSFSPMNSTNPEYYNDSKDWVNTFDTSCGWTDDEQYCPEAIVEAANCSTECTRPYYQTSMDLRKSQGWSEWSSPSAGDCGGAKFACSTALVADPEGSCPPIRARAKLQGGPVHTNNFSFEIEWQLYSFLEGVSMDCWPSYGWMGAGWTNNGASVSIDEVSLVNLNYAELSGTLQPDSNIKYTQLLPTGNRGNRALPATYTTCQGNKITQSATYQKYTTTIDFSESGWDDDYAGAYELTLQLNIGRDIAPLLENDSVDVEGSFIDYNHCQFNETINITIPNFVFIGPPKSKCCDPLILEDRYEDPDRQNFPHEKFYYDKLEINSNGGYKLSTTNAWSAAPPSNRCGNNSPQISCTSDTQSQTNNAETFFPRNGFMIW